MSGHDVRRDHFRFSKICLHFCALVFVILFGTIIVSESVSATGSWLDGDPELIERREYDRKRDQLAERDCSVQTIILALGNTFPGSNTDRQARACMTLGKNFRTAVLLTDEGYETDKVYISVGWDRRFYSFYGWPYWEAERDVLYHVPGTDRVILFGAVAEVIGEGVSRGFKRMDVYDNFHTKLRRDGDYAATYRITGPATSMGAPGYADFTPDDTAMDSADWFLVYGWGVSMNGRYIVYSIPYTIHRDWQDREQQFIRIDTKTGEKRVFGRSFFNRIGFHSHPIRFAVSNDGKEIIASGMGMFKFWEVDSTCLAQVRVSVPEHDPCPTRVFDTKSQGVPPNYSFDDELYYDETTGIVRASFIRTSETVVIRKPGFQLPEKLTYLALGDSYSSGEGDIENGYVKGTERPKQCHLSPKSYPFILRDKWDMPNDHMRSIACSGAKVLADYTPAMDGYGGQTVDLNAMSEAARAETIQMALRTFKPGMVPQIEFVRKYKPEIVTLTGGGNDIGFADILVYCATPSWRIVFVSETCSYAKDEKMRTALINAIHNQYGVTKILISKLREASPRTKIYIVGYPQFVAEPLVSCTLNAGALDHFERQMIRDMVEEFNNVLYRAATDAGVVYLDVETSLSGGQLCESGKYMTGLHNMSVAKMIKSETQELFHPNARGHEKIAESIAARLPATNPQPMISEMEQRAKPSEVYENSPIVQQERITKDIIMRRGRIVIDQGVATFEPNAPIDVTVFSDPVHLGTVVASDDGSLSTTIELSEDVPIGRHLLMLEGRSYSGEEMTLYQPIIVLGENPDDVDSDGIEDSKDKCLFIIEWFDEQSGKNVCSDKEKDAAAVDISEAPQKTIENISAGRTASDMHDNIWQLGDSARTFLLEHGMLQDGLPWSTGNNSSDEVYKDFSDSSIDISQSRLLVASIVILAICAIVAIRRRYAKEN